MPAVAEKRCGRCKLLKPFSEFTKDKNRPHGLAWECRQCKKGAKEDRCRSHPEEERRKRSEASARWRKRHPEANKAQNRKQRRKRQLAKYGLTPEQYEVMYRQQNGKCASCGDSFDVLFVDHDHETGAVRELLCRSCNWGLGNFNDDPAKLEKAAEYLRRHNLRAVA